MKRVRLFVAYDGTNYCGWQIQDNAITIEEVLIKTLREVLNEDIELIGASRTDSGVHALGNVAVFDTNSRIPAEKFSYTLNRWLPDDIKIQKSDEVSADWHPRFVKCNKTYEYKIMNGQHENPCSRIYAHFTYYKLDIEKMREAASYLIGEHDFKSFCSIHGTAKTSVRTINSIDIVETPVDPLIKENKMIAIRINGNGFLYNMVRIIAGTLLQAAIGQIEPSDVKNILEACDRNAAGPTAVAKGLTLIKINFEDEN